MAKSSDPKAPPGNPREQRLAQALRDNLRRRKGLGPVPPQEAAPKDSR